jgi:GGDEF domain-containing protein
MPEDPIATAEETQSSAEVLEAYLSFVSAVADCLKDSCPPIGTPYHLRLNRMRGRLAYDPSAEFFAEGTQVIEAQLVDYARQASAYVSLHGTAFSKGVEALLETVRQLEAKQDFYCTRLRELAAQMEPSQPAARLESCVESLSNDWQSLVGRLRTELAETQSRISEADITDAVTGMMNRREMERHILVQREQGTPEVLLLFSFGAGLPPDVVQQMAQRAVSQFRHSDLIGRWSATELIVLFRGPSDVAYSRLDQVIAWIGGHYLSDSGHSVEVNVEGRLVTYEEALAT